MVTKDAMSGSDKELVVLVDDDDNPIGTADKATVHGGATPLHRGFSCFLWDRSGAVLLQQRSATKPTWPSVWSNSVCGHPGPGEEGEAAVRRRLDRELGLGEASLALALPTYRYRAEHLGVVENEICPVWVGLATEAPRPAADEVADLLWTPWQQLVAGIRGAHEPFYRGLSPWCREEALLLAESEVLDAFLRLHGVRR